MRSPLRPIHRWGARAFRPSGRVVAVRPRATGSARGPSFLRVGAWCVTRWGLDDGRERAAFRVERAGGRAMTFDRDETTVWVDTRDGDVEAWDVATGALVARYEGDPHRVNAVHLTDDGALLRAAYGHHACVSWDRDGGRRAAFVVPSIVGFARDSALVASYLPGAKLRVWNARDGSVLGEVTAYGGMYPLHYCALLPGGTQALIVYGNGACALVDWARGEARPIAAGLKNAGGGFSVSADGATAATCENLGALALWDVASGERLATHALPFDAMDGGAAFDDALSTLVAFDGRSVVHAFDVRRGLARSATAEPRGRVRSFVFAPDGRRFAAVHDDAVTQVHDLDAPSASRLLRHERPVFCAAWSPDGRVLVTGSHDGLHAWDATTCAELAPIERGGAVCAARFEDDGPGLVLAGWRGDGKKHSTAVWRRALDAGEPSWCWRVDPLSVGHTLDWASIAARGEDRVVVLDCRGGTHTLDARTGALRAETRPLSWLEAAVRFACDAGRTAVFGIAYPTRGQSPDPSLRAVDTESGAEGRTLYFPGWPMPFAALSRDEALVAAAGRNPGWHGDWSDPGEVQVCRWPSGERVGSLNLLVEDDLPSSLAFSPDGALLLVGTERGVTLTFSLRDLEPPA
ncbi:MAG: WD40 repeat domain-containing protein [Polyangiales bacterium]